MVRCWNRSFGRRELWPHPRGPPQARNRPDPPLFEVYPEGEKAVLQWCRENIKPLMIVGQDDHDRKPTGALDAKTLNVGLEAGSQSWIQA